MYIYIRTESQLWTVGFYDPSGKFHPESDHDYQDAAARRAAFLNGSNVEQNLGLVTLFLLKNLRQAKTRKRHGKQAGIIYKDPIGWAKLCAHELEADSIYHAFCESVGKNYKIPAFDTAKSLKTAKSFTD